MGDLQRGWRRVRAVPDVGAPLWILTHKDLRGAARVRVLRDALGEAIRLQRDLYAGERPAHR